MTWPVSVHIPIDTDAIHPDSLRAALAIGIDRLEAEAEKRGQAIDWATFHVKLEPKTTEDNTTRIRVGARRIL